MKERRVEMKGSLKEFCVDILVNQSLNLREVAITRQSGGMTAFFLHHRERDFDEATPSTSTGGASVGFSSRLSLSYLFKLRSVRVGVALSATEPQWPDPH